MKNTLLDFFRAFRKTIIIWVVLSIFVAVGIYFGVPKKIIGGGIIAVGWITGAFAGLMTMVGGLNHKNNGFSPVNSSFSISRKIKR